jgi:hypothetical protein
MKCPRCGAVANGKFCGACGAPLGVARCASCQSPLIPDARFCTQCGSPVKRNSNNALWIVGSAVLAALLIVSIYSLLNQGQVEQETAAPTAAAPGTPPPLSENMRENADRLFNRVMRAREAGDTAQMRQFAPMAVMAYENSGTLDADGLYHLSILQTVAGDPATARLTAGRILDSVPQHLLALAAAAEASIALNDSTSARDYYQRFLTALPNERSKPLPEYQDHSGLLPQIESDARAFTGK